jgi:hypothetical protein
MPGVRLRGVLYVAADDESDTAMLEEAKEKQSKKAPEPKGEYGKAWSVLFAKGLFKMPIIREWLDRRRDNAEQSDNDVLHQLFKVTSCSFIPIEDLINEIYLEVTNPTIEQKHAITRIVQQAQEAQNNG